MTSFTTNTTERAVTLPGADYAHWLVRAALAGIFLYHGLTKFPSLAAGSEMMGLPFWLWTLVAVVEAAAGLGLLLGGALRSRTGDLITRASGAGVVAIMIGAIVLVHLGPWSGMEFQVLMLAVGGYFLLRGNHA
jgi:putative oxidoreductase